MKPSNRLLLPRFKVRLLLALLLTSAGSALAQPSLTRQPTNLSLSIGATATFRAYATTSNGPMTYQWRHQDTPLLNATNAMLTLSNIQLADAGVYLVAVSDASGTTNSAPALLDVDPTWTKITTDPIVKEYDIHWGDAAWADYNNDGALDVFLTTARASVGLSGFGPVALFRNDGAGHFTKMTTNEVGSLAAARTDTYVCCWGDYDNDGWLDLYISANSTIATGENRTELLYHNNGDGTFTKVTRGSPVNELGASFGGWLIDVNRDGFLDLVTLQVLAPDHGSVRYYRNNGSSNAWLCVQCVGTASPRSATGTKVRVKATIRGKSMWQLRVIDPGGFANAQNFTAHFGLGDATNVDVLRIEWTSGRVQELNNVPARQYLTVTEPAALSMPQPGELHIQCWQGMTYRIESSTNLLTWESRATVTSTNLSGGAGWTDSEIPGDTARFYRAVKQ
ncbi:MAG: immunoglobulin domain-containing protein [Verrucomicrobia bacterium]|nr:immunoglobulin domain-containing protein [Verrucomicrobiota bacterium]